MSMRKVVVEIKRGVNLEISDPRLVQKPCHRSIRPYDIVLCLFIFSCECVRIIFCVHTSEVSGKTCLKTKSLLEGV